MPRTKIGNQGGFLDDRQFVDGLKVTFFIGAFYTALTWLNEGNQMQMGKRMMTALFWVMSIPTQGTGGVKDMIDGDIKQDTAAEDMNKLYHKVVDQEEDLIPKVRGLVREEEERKREEEEGPKERTIGEGIRDIPSRIKKKTGAAKLWTRRKLRKRTRWLR